MGQSFSGMAVRADRASVVAELSEIYRRRDVRLRPPSADDREPPLSVRTSAGWTVVEHEGRGMPGVCLDLSRRLRARVVSFDVDERLSYAHVADVDRGAPLLVFTMWQAQLVELFPHDVTSHLAAGYARSSRRFPETDRQLLDAGLWAGHERLLFDFFHESLAPIDVRAFALEAFESPDETFMVDGDAGVFELDPRAGRFWYETTGTPKPAQR